MNPKKNGALEVVASSASDNILTLKGRARLEALFKAGSSPAALLPVAGALLVSSLSHWIECMGELLAT